MKRIKNKITALLFVMILFAFCFPFAACSGDDGDDGNGGGGNKGGEEYWVERIEVTKGAGFQEAYMDGEAFNTTGLTVKAYWNDGYIEDNVTNFHVIPRIITEGVEKVTVFYGDASYELTISSAYTVGIEIERLPTVTTYFQGEVFDPTGMVLHYTLDNGSSRAIKNYNVLDVEFDIKPFAYGDDSISIGYAGYNCTVPITVKGSGFKMEVNTSPNCVMSGTEGYKAGTNATLKSLASNNDFMQDFSVGSIMTFTFESETPQINFLFQGASSYVSQYGTGSDRNYPVVVEDMQVSRVFDMTVNGQEIPISDDAILRGIASEDGETAHVEYLANYTEVNLGILDVYTDSINTIELTFKDNGYRNAIPEGGAGPAKMPAPYIDYFMVSYLPDENIEKIEVTAPQTKTIYVAGQSFDPTGMEVTAYYTDETDEIVSGYKINPSGALTRLGKNYITIGYRGHSATVEVTVVEKEITGIEITNPPDKTLYGVGQIFDPAGMVVTASYNDGTTAVITDYEYTPDTPLTLADITVTVTFGEFSDTCTLTITDEDLLEGIIISGISANTFTEGDYLPDIDPASITVSAVYVSGNKSVLDPSEYTLEIDSGVVVIGSGITATLNSDSSITATALYKVTKVIDTKKVNVKTDIVDDFYRNNAAWHNGAIDGDFIQKSRDGVTIQYTFESASAGYANLILSGSSGWVTLYESTPKAKGDMQANVMFDLYVNDAKVTMDDSVIFRGGEYATARNENLADWHLINLAAVLLQSGSNTVELRFKPYTYTNSNGTSANPYIDYLVISTVNDAEVPDVASIEITNQPTKTDYVRGQTFDPAGMVVTANYNSAPSGVITDYTVNPAVLNTLGKNYITVSYLGKTATVEVNVIAREISYIIITSLPDKTEYTVGQNLNLAGLEVTAVYNDGSREVIDGYDVDTTKLNTAGDNIEITVSYVGKTATFEVEVVDKAITDIAITSDPDTLDYLFGQTLDLTGLVVTATYNDGSSAVITDYECSLTGPLTLSDTTVTITAGGYTKTFTITVSDWIEYLEIVGISANNFIEGNLLPDVNAEDITVTAVYASGSKTVLDPSEYNLTIDNGIAQVGAGIKASLKGEMSVVTTVYYNVTKTIDTKDGNLTNKEGASIRGDASWHNGAIGADFVQNAKNGTIITYTVGSASEAYATIIISGSSGWVTEYAGEPKAPKTKGDMQANVMFDLYVNGELVEMDDSVVFRGGEYDFPTNENLADWHLINLAVVLLKEGNNVIELRFKEFSYPNAGAAAGTSASPYIDYLIARTSNNAEITSVESIEVTGQPDKTVYVEGQTFDRTGMEVTVTYAGGETAVIGDYTFSPIGALTTLGTNYITISYLGYTDTVEVTVIERVVTAIEITRLPNKTDYTLGQTVSLEGLEVTATYNDGTTGLVNGYSHSPDTPLTLLDTTVTITLGAYFDSFIITVEDIDMIKSIIISGVSGDTFAEGAALPELNPLDVTVTAVYYSGNTVPLNSLEYSIEIDTGIAALGSKVTATLNSDPSITSTVYYKVTKTIDTNGDNIIASGTGPASCRDDASWHNGALNGDFIQNSRNGAIISYTVEAVSEGYATLTLSGSSGWVTGRANGTTGNPNKKGDMQANIMFDLYVNGVKIEMDDSVLFLGGEYAVATNNNLADWHLIELANALLQEGTNTIELKFKAYTYTNVDNGTASPYIDYLVVST